MRAKLRDEYIFVVLGAIGILLGFTPVLRVGNVYVTLTDYGQSGDVAVSIGSLEHIRLAYIPLLFTSVYMFLLFVPSLVARSYGVTDDVKLVVSAAYALSAVPVTLVADIGNTVSHAYTAYGITVYLDTSNVEFLPTYYIIKIGTVPVLLVAALAVTVFYAMRFYKKSTEGLRGSLEQT